MVGSGGRLLAAGVMVSALVVAGCSSGVGGGGSAPPTTPARSSLPSSPPTPSPGANAVTPSSASPTERPATATATATATAERVTLAFAGDVHFEGQSRGVLRNGAALRDSLRGTVGTADFALVNLETAIGTGGSPLPGKTYTFRAPASALDLLADAGFDAVSMANNHAVDFGTGVFAQTLEAKAASPIPVVGIGRTAAEAFTPVRVDVQGLRVAVLASSQVPDVTARRYAATDRQPGIATNIGSDALRRAVRSAAATSDLVVVVMHWGTEYVDCADASQRRTAAQLADDGADIVVGGHGHRPQGAGWRGNIFVGYGLGNFVWHRNNDGSGDSGVLVLTVDAKRARSTAPQPGPAVVAADWRPMTIGSDGIPRAPRASTADRLARDWSSASACSGLSPRPTPQHTG